MSKINSKITLGFEIETSSFRSDYLSTVSRNGAVTTRDKSVLSDAGSVIYKNGVEVGGHEIISKPYIINFSSDQDGNKMAINATEALGGLKDLLSSVEGCNSSCGFHIHLGRPTSTGQSKWEPEKVRMFLAVGIMLEDMLFNVCPASRKTNAQCKKISECYTKDQISSYYPVKKAVNWKYDNQQRYCWLNLIETNRDAPPSSSFRNTADGSTQTIEVRMMGSTADAAYLGAWLTLWAKVAAFISNIPSSLVFLHTINGTFTHDLQLLASYRERVREKIVSNPTPHIDAVTISNLSV